MPAPIKAQEPYHFHTKAPTWGASQQLALRKKKPPFCQSGGLWIIGKGEVMWGILLT